MVVRLRSSREANGGLDKGLDHGSLDVRQVPFVRCSRTPEVKDPGRNAAAKSDYFLGDQPRGGIKIGMAILDPRHMPRAVRRCAGVYSKRQEAVKRSCAYAIPRSCVQSPGPSHEVGVRPEPHLVARAGRDSGGAPAMPTSGGRDLLGMSRPRSERGNRLRGQAACGSREERRRRSSERPRRSPVVEPLRARSEALVLQERHRLVRQAPRQLS